MLEYLVALVVLAPVIALIVSLIRTQSLGKRIAELEKRMRNLETGSMFAPAQKSMTTESTAKQTASVQEAADSLPVESVEIRSATPAAVPTPTPVSAQASDEAPARKTPLTSDSLEALIGGKVLNRIGAVALVFATGFFLKYAFDNNWLTETMRVGIGAVTGLLLLAGSRYFDRKNYSVFSQGLAGAGISILYLSVYASYNFYHLLPQSVAFVMMAAVTFVAFIEALRTDSLAVSVIALAGGFLTPFFLSTNQSNEIALFVYIAVLDAGIIAVTLRRERWVILEPLALIATYVTFWVWFGTHYSESKLGVMLALLAVLWLLFLALDVSRLWRPVSSFTEIRHVVGILNALLFFTAVFELVDSHNHEWMGGAALLIGLVYASVSFISGERTSDAATSKRLVITGCVWLITATAIQFDTFLTVTFWSVEAMVLCWIGMTYRKEHIWWTGLATVGLIALTVLIHEQTWSYSEPDSIVPILNLRSLALFSAAMAAIFCSFQSGRENIQLGSGFRTVLHVLWSGLFFLLMSVEIVDAFEWLAVDLAQADHSHLMYLRFPALIVAWSLYGSAMLYLSGRYSIREVRVTGWVVLFLGVIFALGAGSTYIPISRFFPVLNFRVFSMIVAAACLFWSAQQIPDTDDTARKGRSLVHIAVLILVFVLITGETVDYFDLKLYEIRAGDTDPALTVGATENLKQLSLSGIWLLYSITLMVAGIVGRRKILRISAIAVFAISIFKIFLVDLSSLDTLHRIFSFVGLGLVLLLVSYLYQKYKDVLFGDESP